MIQLVIGIIIIISLVLLIGYAIKRMKMSQSDAYAVPLSETSYEIPKSETVLLPKDYKMSADEMFEVEEFTFKRGIGLMSLSALILGVHASIFIPAVSNLITWTKGEPLWGLFIIYLPYILVLTTLISGITKRDLFNLTSLRFVVTIGLFTLLADLWMPNMILKTNLEIFISSGYRVSPDYAMFSVWKRLFGLEILKMEFLGLTVGWLLTYVLSTVLICLLIFIVWWSWVGYANSES